MSTIWIIAKIAIYTFFLVVLYRQSYNFLFVLTHRPKTWIAVVGLLGILNMGLAYTFGWNPRLVSTATLIAFLLNIVPSPPTGAEKGTRCIADEIYKEWGLPYGRLQKKIGLAAFVVCSLVSYVLFFAEYCNANGQCTPFILTLLYG